MLKVDLHLHTRYSADGFILPEGLIARCLEVGLDAIAVTDHNTIEGALATKAKAPFPVIIGEEVLSAQGEIIGLFLEKPVPKGLPVLETVARIREQGGLVVIPHPFDRLWRHRLLRKSLESILPQIDILEVFNARTVFPSDCARARRFAEEHGLPMGAGSDAHLLRELGYTYVEMPPFDGPKEFMAALKQSRVVGRPSGLWVHIPTTLGKRLPSLFRW